MSPTKCLQRVASCSILVNPFRLAKTATYGTLRTRKTGPANTVVGRAASSHVQERMVIPEGMRKKTGSRSGKPRAGGDAGVSGGKKVGAGTGEHGIEIYDERGSRCKEEGGKERVGEG